MRADVCRFVKSGWDLARAGESRPDRLDDTASSDGYASDSALVRACVVGSPGAFDALMRRHQRQVYLVCYRFTSNHEDAADLSQDVFLRVHRGLARFKGDAALSTWLYRIAVNVCLNHVNTKGPSTQELEPERLSDRRGTSPVERVARQERSIRVRAAMPACRTGSTSP